MNEVVIAIIAGIATIVGTLGGVVAAIVKTGSDARSAREIRLDGRIDAVIALQEKRLADQDATISDMKAMFDRKLATVGRVLRQIAQQWVGDSHGPNIDPADIAELEEVFPREWIRRGR